MNKCEHGYDRGKDLRCVACDLIALQAENARLTSEVSRLRQDAYRFGRLTGILCVEASQEHWHEVREAMEPFAITFPDGVPFAALDKPALAKP